MHARRIRRGHYLPRLSAKRLHHRSQRQRGRRLGLRLMLTAADLISEAIEQNRLQDFGGDEFREGLDILTESLATEADLTDLGAEILGLRLRMLLTNRLRVEDVYRRHPEIADQIVEGPLVGIGLPRTGTTALSQLVSADPQIRSLRLWESTSPVPAPESATEDTDPRIEETAQGLDAM